MARLSADSLDSLDSDWSIVDDGDGWRPINPRQPKLTDLVLASHDVVKPRLRVAPSNDDAGRYGSGDIIQMFHDAQVFVSTKGVNPALRPAAYELIDRIRQMTDAGDYHNAQVLVQKLPDCDPKFSPNLPRASGISAIRDATYAAIERVRKENTGFSLSNAAHSVGQAATSVGEGIGSVASSVGKAAYGVGKGVVSGVGSVAHLVATPAIAAMHIAKGDNVAASLGGAFKEAVKDIKDVAPLAQTVIGFVPGIGSGVNAAIAAGSALAQGANISDALIAAAQGAIPGGPLAKQAMSTGVNLLKGQNVTQAALDAARNNIPGGAIAKQAFDTGIALAQGQQIQQVLKGKAMSFGDDLISSATSAASNALSPVASQVLSSVGPRIGDIQKAAVSLIPQGSTQVAKALLRNPDLRAATVDQIANRLNVPIHQVKEGMASLVNSVSKAGGSNLPGLVPAKALEQRMAGHNTFDQMMSRFGSHVSRPSFTPNARGHREIRWFTEPRTGKLAATVLKNVEAAYLSEAGWMEPMDYTRGRALSSWHPVHIGYGKLMRAIDNMRSDAGAFDPNVMPLIGMKWRKTNNKAAVMLAQGILGVGVDGDFGPGTDTAARNYQKAHGLSVDGQIGHDTWLSFANIASSASTPNAPATPQTATINIPTVTPSAANVATYIVSSGDTMTKIAQKFTGSGSRWPELAKANPQVKDPNMIRVGQILTIPTSWGTSPVTPTVSIPIALPNVGPIGVPAISAPTPTANTSPTPGFFPSFPAPAVTVTNPAIPPPPVTAMPQITPSAMPGLIPGTPDVPAAASVAASGIAAPLILGALALVGSQAKLF